MKTYVRFTRRSCSAIGRWSSIRNSARQILIDLWLQKGQTQKKCDGYYEKDKHKSAIPNKRSLLKKSFSFFVSNMKLISRKKIILFKRGFFFRENQSFTTNLGYYCFIWSSSSHASRSFLHVIVRKNSSSISNFSSPPFWFLFNNLNLFTSLELQIARFFRGVRKQSHVIVCFRFRRRWNCRCRRSWRFGRGCSWWCSCWRYWFGISFWKPPDFT